MTEEEGRKLDQFIKAFSDQQPQHQFLREMQAAEHEGYIVYVMCERPATRNHISICKMIQYDQALQNQQNQQNQLVQQAIQESLNEVNSMP